MDMTWHDTERKKDGKMRHPTDSETWKDVDKEWPEFVSDSRNLQLALSSDGFNPFHGNRTDYSSWTVLLSIYNLPPWLCMKRRGILLWTISDYPALGNLSGNVIKGYNACTVCVDNTKATRLVHYRKTVVMRHRRWLPRHHPYRKQKTTFDNTVEKDVAPIPLTGEQVFGRVQHLRDHVFGKTQRQPRWKKGEARPVWKKVSIFFQLEYWKFLPVRHVLDVMHIGKNICEALLGTFLNIPGKRKDRESVRLDMADMGIRTELRQKTPGKKEKAIYSKVIDVDKLEKMQSELVETLCQLEKHFLPSFFDVMIHLSVHLVRGVKLCAPIFLHWMYPFERYMKAFKGYVRNPAHLEGCIAEAYIAEEAVEYLVYFDEATIGLIENVRHDQNGISRPLSGATIIKPSKEDLQLAHLCFLQNSNDIGPYFE
ncbi:uncharacterized protein LOC141674350 [Apium graveolens]|uniref:uncharacterized protein LOC141674350 n=1 Tax=Apium graveolens TaxID=4045 RepID=UPI003D7B9920